MKKYLPNHYSLQVEETQPLSLVVTEHPEMAALLFTSSVCLGLLLTLLAVSIRVTCRGRRQGSSSSSSRLAPKKKVACQDDRDNGNEEGEEEEREGEETESSLISVAERKEMSDWEQVEYTTEAAERAERIERREMIIQEIWMNAYLNGSSYSHHWNL